MTFARGKCRFMQNFMVLSQIQGNFSKIFLYFTEIQRIFTKKFAYIKSFSYLCEKVFGSCWFVRDNGLNMSNIDIRHPLIVCRASAGTGKTFTLAAYYIAMLLSGESHRNILAVTFTNAATAEMKERILTYLLGIASGREDEFLRVVRTYMLRGDDAPDERLRERAQENLHAILQDYDNFAVTTIDSFLQQLIRGIAQALNRTADFTVSLDPEQVITEAVDNMLTNELNDDNRRTVYEYIEQQLGESKGWDIRQNLIRIAMQLYRESVQANNTRLDLDARSIADYRKALFTQRQTALAQFKQIAEQAKNDLDSKQPYTQSRNAKYAIENIYKSATDPQSLGKDQLYRGATDAGKPDMLSDPQLRALQHACDDMRLVHWQTTYSLTYLNDMRLMNALEDSIQKSLLRTNTALLADTAVTLAEALKPGDADFILEKAGIRYRHIMMDEFQDTSLLQWNVFLHLIKELLAVQGQTILIVGDTKQSIYRFRNGNWQIMESIGKTQLQDACNPHTAPLVRNQRSRRNVVAFNLGVMQHIAQQANLQMAVDDQDPRPVGSTLYSENANEQTLADYYRTDKHEGGYVRCRFYPYYDKSTARRLQAEQMAKEIRQQVLWDDVCATIEDLLRQGEQPQDILVLGRFNNELQQWAAYSRTQDEPFPLLSRTPMVSRDSFRLESSITVLLLIEALRYIHTGSQAAAAFLRTHRENDVVERIGSIGKMTPLYDQVQHLLQIIGCEQGCYRGADVAYVNCFLDETQRFIAQNGSDVPALLRYWGDTMHKAAVSGDSCSNAIRLMTVHSSKGLEGKTVIILDAGWQTERDRQDDILWSESIGFAGSSLPLIPVKQDAKLQLTGEHSPYYQAYKQEHEAQLVDNYNLLYVALTRAADNLYVYALVDIQKHADDYPTVAASLLDYTHLRSKLQDVTESEQTYLEFSVGTEPFIHMPVEQRSRGTFDYANTETIQAQIYSDGTQVHFRQSQESTQYMLQPDEAETHTAQADFGILCHDIFAHISRADESLQVIDAYRKQGLIADDKQQKQITELIRKAFTDSHMQQWFDGSWQLMREAAIITPNAVSRPDRVMIKDDSAVVLDYKFTGKQQHEHILQVRDYMYALRKMGYTKVEGWLWYAFSGQLVEVGH